MLYHLCHFVTCLLLYHLSYHLCHDISPVSCRITCVMLHHIMLHHITSSLDPKADTTITLDGKTIHVPQGKPINTSYTNSNFSQSEYLVYKESQTCIRYMLQIKFA